MRARPPLRVLHCVPGNCPQAAGTLYRRILAKLLSDTRCGDEENTGQDQHRAHQMVPPRRLAKQPPGTDGRVQRSQVQGHGNPAGTNDALGPAIDPVSPQTGASTSQSAVGPHTSRPGWVNSQAANGSSKNTPAMQMAARRAVALKGLGQCFCSWRR